MSSTWNTIESNWQGIDDEPTAGSDNLVKSGGVQEKVGQLEQELNGGIAVTERQSINPQTELTDTLLGFLRVMSYGWDWLYSAGSGYSAFIKIADLDIVPTHLKIIASTGQSQIAFLKKKLPESNANQYTLKYTYIADDGEVYNGTSYPYHRVLSGQTRIFEIPDGTNYIYIKLSTLTYNYTPSIIEFLVGTQVIGITEKIGDLSQLNTEDKTSIVNAINEVSSDATVSKIVGFSEVGKSVEISSGFGNINTRIVTGISGKKGYKYKITCDNTNGLSTALWRLFPNNTGNYLTTAEVAAGDIWSNIYECSSDYEQLYISCNNAVVITIEVLGTNEDMFPLDLRNIGLEQGNLTGNTAGSVVTKISDTNVVRLKIKIPAIKRDFNGLRVWFANIPPAIVREGQDYSDYSWRYRCYFLNAEGKAITNVGSLWPEMTDNFAAAQSFDNSAARQATDIWITFVFSNGTTFAPITPDDIPFGTLRMVMGKDYSSVTTDLLNGDIEKITGYFDVKDFRYTDYCGISASGVDDGSTIKCFCTSDYFRVNSDGIKIKTNARTDGKTLLWRVVYYDKNKTFISSTGSYANPSNRIAPNNAIFFRLSFLMKEEGVEVQTTSADLEYGNLLITISKDSLTSQLEKIGTTLYGNKLVNLDPDKVVLIKASKQAADNYGMNNNGTNFPTLFITTDIHSQWNYPHYLSYLEKTLAYGNTLPEINLMMMLGDLDDNPITLGNKNWKQLVLAQDKPLLAIAGNHEVYKSTSWTDPNNFQGFTDATLFDYFYNSDTITKCGEVHGGTDHDKPYYYKDLAPVTYYAIEQGDKVTKTFKLRLICLYQYEYVTPTDSTTGAPLNNYKSQYKVFSQDQIDWLLDVLDSCDADTHIMVIAHEAICTGMKPTDTDWNCTTPAYTTRTEVNNMSDNLIIPKIIDAWVNGSTVQTTCNMGVGNPLETYVTVTVNHTFNSAHHNKFVCYLGGHVHADYIVAHDDYPEQIQVLLTCTNNLFTQQSGELYRGNGKHRYSGTAITYIPLSKTLRGETPTKREIRLIHVGADKKYNMKDQVMTSVLLESY